MIREPGQGTAYAAAVDLIGRGLFVTPMPTAQRRPEPGWLARATGDPAAVASWPADAGVAVACRPSGVVVLDLDIHPATGADHAGIDGVAQLQALADAAAAQVPVTFTVATPHGGRHLYYRLPAGLVVLSASGPASPLGPGIDVRAPGRRSGGYVLAPGTHLPTGTYVVDVDALIAVLPTWLTRALMTAR